MASYVEKYNYNSISPFRTNYEGMLRGLQTKESYWKLGVQRVKSAAEQATGLSLTGDVAKNKLNNFMTNANKELQKSLASDLSMSGNAASAVNIFSPLYKDDDLMNNHSLTDFYNKEFSNINKAKTADGGKYYNYNNELYVKQAYDDFAKGVDNGIQAREFQPSKKSYTPYYDVSKETFEIFDKCKADKSSLQGQASDPLMLKTETNNGLTSAKLSGCLVTSLSDKAKQQISIDESVRYHNNIPELAKAWTSMGAINVKNAQEDIATYIKERDKQPKNSKEYEYFNNVINSTKKDLENNISNLNNIARGDYTDVQNNFTNYAYQLGVRNHISNFSNAFDHADYKIEYDANLGAMQHDRQQFDANMNVIKFGQDVKLKQMDYDNQLKLKFLDIYKRNPTDSELIGFKSNQVYDPEADKFTLNTDMSNDNSTPGLILQQNMDNDVKGLSNQLTSEATTLQNTLGANDAASNPANTAILDALGVQKGNALNPLKATNIAGQISNIKEVIKIHDDKIRLGQPSPYSNIGISTLKNYISKYEDINNKIAIKNQTKDLLNKKVDELTAADMSSLNKNASSVNLVVRKNSGQPVQITGATILDLQKKSSDNPVSGDGGEDIFRSGNWELKRESNGSLTVNTWYHNGERVSYEAEQSINKVAQPFESKLISVSDKRRQAINQVWGDPIIQASDIYTIRDEKQQKKAEDEAILKSGLTDESWKKLGYSVRGYDRNNNLVVFTGKDEKANTLLVTGGGIALKDAKGNQFVTLPSSQRLAPVIPDDMESSEDMRRMNTAYIKYGTGTKVFKAQTVQRPKNQPSVEIRLRAVKDASGNPLYHIETLRNGVWDIDVNESSTYPSYEAAYFNYNRAVQLLKTN